MNVIEFCYAVYNKVLGCIFLSKFVFLKGVEYKDKIKLVGLPMIHIRNGGQIKIGENVTLNSRNHGYHINMHSKVKLLADEFDATITIGSNTRIHGACIHAKNSITIGSRVLIAANSHIIDSSGHDLSLSEPNLRIYSTGQSKPVVIEDDVWICANVFILPGVTIGSGSVIGAGSVVTENIPCNVLAAGNPAKIIKKIN